MFCFVFPISHFFSFSYFILFCMFSFSNFILFCMLSFSNFMCFHTFSFLISYAFYMFLNFLCFLIFLFCTLSNVMYITCTIHTTTCGMGFSLSQHYEGKRLHGEGAVREWEWE